MNENKIINDKINEDNIDINSENEINEENIDINEENEIKKDKSYTKNPDRLSGKVNKKDRADFYKIEGNFAEMFNKAISAYREKAKQSKVVDISSDLANLDSIFKGFVNILNSISIKAVNYNLDANEEAEETLRDKDLEIADLIKNRDKNLLDLTTEKNKVITTLEQQLAKVTEDLKQVNIIVTNTSNNLLESNKELAIANTSNNKLSIAADNLVIANARLNKEACKNLDEIASLKELGVENKIIRNDIIKVKNNEKNLIAEKDSLLGNLAIQSNTNVKLHKNIEELERLTKEKDREIDNLNKSKFKFENDAKNISYQKEILEKDLNKKESINANLSTKINDLEHALMNNELSTAKALIAKENEVTKDLQSKYSVIIDSYKDKLYDNKKIIEELKKELDKSSETVTK